MRVNTIRGDELFVRCTFCGDSRSNPNLAHLSINVKNSLYHCFKCGQSGKMPLNLVIDFTTRAGYDFFSQLDHSLSHSSVIDDVWGDNQEDDEVWPDLYEGAAFPRKSKLERFHAQYQNKRWDAFTMREANGDECGVHLRRPDAKSSHGDVGFGYTGEYLTSSDDNPLYLVEGPYDVVRADHVCTFGLITSAVLSRLRGQAVILVPDGDVWSRRDLLYRTSETWAKTKRRGWRGAYVVGIDILPDGADPDECDIEDRIPVRGDREMHQLFGKLGARCNTDYRLRKVRQEFEHAANSHNFGGAGW